MIYFAHSENKFGKRHDLSKHLLRTAEFMEHFAYKEEFRKIFTTSTQKTTIIVQGEDEVCCKISDLIKEVIAPNADVMKGTTFNPPLGQSIDSKNISKLNVKLV